MPASSEAAGEKRPWPKVTVCLCTHNRPDYVRGCLAGLQRQSLPADQFDIVVVDSGSSGDAPARLAALVADIPNARMIRIDLPGVSLARNAGAAAARGDYVAYIDDDAIPAPDWVAQIQACIVDASGVPAVLGGRILPVWEVPLPAWWPRSLRGVLSIIETEGKGAYGDAALPPTLAPFGANMIVHVPTMRSVGGFCVGVGRDGRVLLSDEDVQLAWRLQRAGYAVRFDSRVVVHHQIQAGRMTPDWLLRRMYWQGASSVITRRMLGEAAGVWWSLPRRLAVALLFLPAGLMSRSSVRWLPCRWRLAFSLGYVRAALIGI